MLPLCLVSVGLRPFAQVLRLQLLRSFMSATGPTARGVGGFLGLSLGALRPAVTHHLYSLLLQLVLLQLNLPFDLLCLVVV